LLGSNQAVMSAKLGLADPQHQKNIFVCCVGNDANGNKMISNFEQHQFFNVKKHIRVLEGVPSGLANVMVDTNTGFNRIIIVAGANAHLSNAHVDESWSDIEEHCAVLVCQLETSVDVALHAFRKAKQSKILTVLNTAPARKDLPDELLQLTDLLVPNEEEAGKCYNKL